MARTLEEIDEEIAEVEASRRAFLKGSRVTEMGKGDRSLKFATGGAADELMLRRRLAELKAERARVAGVSGTHRPVKV